MRSHAPAILRLLSATFLFATPLLAEEDAPIVAVADASAAVRLRAVLDKVAAHGEYAPPEAPIPGRVTLEDPAKPDESKDYVVHIAAIYGAVIENRLYAQVASVESRDWKRQPDGNWRMEQWQYRVDLNGNIERCVHRVRIENARHTSILRQDSEDVAMNGPRGRQALSIYNRLLVHWDAWKPGNK